MDHGVMDHGTWAQRTGRRLACERLLQHWSKASGIIQNAANALDKNDKRTGGREDFDDGEQPFCHLCPLFFFGLCDEIKILGGTCRPELS